jgi:hypothetical protein
MVLIIKILGLLITWGPVVLRAIQQVETLLGNKSGKEKKKAATELIKEGLALKGIEFDKDAQSMVSGLIDLSVSALNAWQGWKRED